MRIRLDPEASRLIKAAAKKSKRSTPKEVSWIICEYFRLIPKPAPADTEPR